MHWTVAAPFFYKGNMDNAIWIDNFVPMKNHTFTKIPREEILSKINWHKRKSRNTTITEWFGYWKQSREAWKEARDGCITVFPQLANMVGIKKRLSSKNKPLIAWCFNVGATYKGLKQYAALLGLSNVDKFIVHSNRERETLSSWLNLPISRFEFFHLQRAPIPIVENEDIKSPFLLSMGSAHRDYRTFFEAVKKLGKKTIVVASKHSINCSDIPNNVEVRSMLTIDECHKLAQRARLNIVPLDYTSTAAGQVTVVEAMRMKKAVIATHCVGTEDYIKHEVTGILVKPNSVNALANAIDYLWANEKLRNSIGLAAGKYAEQNFSDEAAGKNLCKVLNSF